MMDHDCEFCQYWHRLKDAEYMGECKNKDMIKAIWVEPYSRGDEYKTCFSFGCKYFRRRCGA